MVTLGLQFEKWSKMCMYIGGKAPSEKQEVKWRPRGRYCVCMIALCRH